MPTFAYEARDSEGQLTVGSIAAETLDHAGVLLSERNLFVVRLAGGDKEVIRPVLRGHATRQEIAWLISQLSVMIETGIPLSDALDCLARQASKPALRAMLEQVSKQVREGRSLSDAMSLFPRAFPGSLVALIRASEMSGKMSAILRRSSSYLMQELQAIKKVRSALLYPVFMFVMSIAVTAFLLIVILPRFAQIFASRGALLPLPTRMLMGLSHSMVAHWYVWLGGLGTAVGLTLLWWRSPMGKRQIGNLAISVPVLSGVFNTLYQGRSFRTLAVLMESGVPLVQMMPIVHEVVPHGRYRELWQRVDEQMRRGERMSGPLLNSELIPEPIAQMIDSGDRSGQLGLVFNRLADFVEEEHQQALRTATQFVEPCMILFLGSIIGFIAASLMLPLFQASQVIAK